MTDDDLDKTSESQSDLSGMGFILLFLGGLIGALAILGYQIFQWLKTGSWHPLPLSFVLDWLGTDLTPIYAPRDWHGVAKIAQYIVEMPLAFVVFLLGCGGSCYFYSRLGLLFED